MSYIPSHPLNRAFNVAVLHIAGRLHPQGFDVIPNDDLDTLAKLKAHVDKTKRFAVWAGASDTTIFGDPEVNYAFRAWHDWCHYLINAEFDHAGESAVCKLMQEQCRAIFGTNTEFDALIEAEVMGQLNYKRVYGEFPRDQAAFTRVVLANPEVGV